MINDATIAENKVFYGAVVRVHNWSLKGAVNIVSYQENHRFGIALQALNVLLVVDLCRRLI
jgi:hypothetical protein